MSDTPNPIDLQKHLGGVSYPASRDDLVASAQQSGADDTVVDALKALPDRTFDGPTAVSEAVTSK